MQATAGETGAAFPPGFVWGVATAAYQVEGAVAEDGRRPSIWDTFSHMPGSVVRGDTGDRACDHYHRFESDFDLLNELGVASYRFSVAWPRVQPLGSGAVNQRGLDFYRRLVDGLRRRGIEPMATLYHWDLPQPLEDAGGWAVRGTAERFGEYAAVVAEALGDGVARWVTLNEPWVAANHGYREGIHAPGRRDRAAAAAATHHLLLAHARGVSALRAVLPARSPVGITLDMTVVRPRSPQLKAIAESLEAAKNWLYLDPVVRGRYPEGAEPSDVVPPASVVRDGDLAAISAPIDFLGVNYYTSQVLGWRDPGDELRRGETRLGDRFPGVVEVVDDTVGLTASGWPIDPDGLHALLLLVADRAPGLPLYITENGMAAEDYIDPEGGVDDLERIDYLRSHLRAAQRAVSEGVDLRGYYHWSLLDNFEWAEGYAKRFGLYYVDYGDQRRVAKASAAFYRRVVEENAVPAD